MNKFFALFLTMLMLFSAAIPAMGENAADEWTDAELEEVYDILNDDTSSGVLPSEFRYVVENGDYSITEGLDKDVMNILLLGTDNAGNAGHGRTDTMIICSINTKTGEVKLSSIVRDLYVHIPYMKLQNRINAANSFGGPNMAIKCVNEALGLNISRYASINFNGFKDLVDLLGGVELEITAGEANQINASTRGGVKEGLAMLNGAQALEYCRIRNLDNNFGRNERQRKFLEAVVKKVLSENSMDQLMTLVEAGMGMVTTNMTTSDLFTILFTVLPNMQELQMYSCPAQGEYHYEEIREASVVVANLEKARTSLHAFIYGEDAE
ncbi:MAG: LCP family protein [Clostridia bacterium]|nr:LCP family protein [Clostridia bacterium]